MVPPLAAAPPAPCRSTAQRSAPATTAIFSHVDRRPPGFRNQQTIAGQNPRRRRGTRRGSGVLPELQGCCGRANAATPSRAAGEPARPRGAPAPHQGPAQIERRPSAAMASAEGASRPGQRVGGGSSHERPRSPSQGLHREPDRGRWRGRCACGRVTSPAQSTARRPDLRAIPWGHQPAIQPAEQPASRPSSQPSSQHADRAAKQPAKKPASQPRSQPNTGWPGRGVREASTRDGTPPTTQFLNFSTVLQGNMLLAPRRLPPRRRSQDAGGPPPGTQALPIAWAASGSPRGGVRAQSTGGGCPTSKGGRLQGRDTRSCNFVLHLT